MKSNNSFVFSCFLFITLASLNFYCNNQQQEEVEGVRLARQDEQLINENLDSIQTNNDAIADTGAHQVKIGKAKGMVQKYLNSVRYIRHRAPGRNFSDDTKFVWLEAAFIDSLYHTMHAEGADGVRVYFGVYNEDSDGPMQLFKTVLFTTTKPKQQGNRTIHEDNLTEASFFAKEYWNKFMPPMNHGSLCPPPNSCFAEGALLLPSNQ